MIVLSGGKARLAQHPLVASKPIARRTEIASLPACARADPDGAGLRATSTSARATDPATPARDAQDADGAMKSSDALQEADTAEHAAAARRGFTTIVMPLWKTRPTPSLAHSKSLTQSAETTVWITRISAREVPGATNTVKSTWRLANATPSATLRHRRV